MQYKHELEVAFESLTDGIILFDETGHGTFVNKGYRTLFPVGEPDVYRRSLHKRAAIHILLDAQRKPMPEEQWPIVRVLRGEVLTDVNTVDGCIRLPDGSEVWVRISGAPTYNAEGKITGGVVILRNVTERMQLERLLREAFEEADARVSELEAVLESLADAVTIYDATGHLLRQNTTAKQLLRGDYHSSEYPTRFLQTLDKHVLLREEFSRAGIHDQALVARALRGELITGANTVDLQVESGAGREVTVNLSAAPIRNAAGQTIGAVTTARDVTKRRTAERERAQMMTVVAHELKTPLTALKLQTYMLKQQATQGMFVQHDIEGLEYDIARTEHLVNDLLDAARLDTDQVAFDITRCDLTHLCELTAREQMELTGRTVILQLPKIPLEIRADMARTNQILINLLSNALKYSSANSAVTLGLQQEDNMARVWVRDAGPGIPSNAIGHLFEQFYRVPDTKSQHGSNMGLGLGLYICRKLVQLQGGQIGVESILGQGSTFWFTLPCIQGRASQSLG
ncbi:MAG: hypothetical protein NVS4B11_05350 [Ktedonobacteraceae bacterium]